MYVFARLAPHAQTWADEDEMIARLRAVPVLGSLGRSFHSREDQKGWARIVIAVESTYSNGSFDADRIGSEAGQGRY